MSSVSSISLTIFFLLLGFFSIAVQSADGPPISSDEPRKGGGGLCTGFEKPRSCPINCFRADPVCGDDGITYWCGCPDAACRGVSVVKLGACDAGNGGSASVPGQALLLVHIVWLILLGFSMLFGLF